MPRKSMEDSDVLCSVQDSSIVIPVKEVDAMCTKIEFVPYSLFDLELPFRMAWISRLKSVSLLTVSLECIKQTGTGSTS
jgi:hypothetical protein